MLLQGTLVGSLTWQGSRGGEQAQRCRGQLPHPLPVTRLSGQLTRTHAVLQCHPTWRWPVLRAHSRRELELQTGSTHLEAQAAEGTQRGMRVSYRKGVAEVPEAGGRLWGDTKGPGRPRGCRGADSAAQAAEGPPHTTPSSQTQPRPATASRDQGHVISWVWAGQWPALSLPSQLLTHQAAWCPTAPQGASWGHRQGRCGSPLHTGSRGSHAQDRQTRRVEGQG